MKEKMKMKYRVKMFNDFSEPYWLNDDENGPIVMHKLTDEYITYDECAFKQILDYFLDAPKKKMTEKDVRKDFDDERRGHKLSDSVVESIMAYYNGRLDLRKKICSDLKKINSAKMNVDVPLMFKYKIPFKMNFFSCNEDDARNKRTTQNDAYIEIEVSKLADL